MGLHAGFGWQTEANNSFICLWYFQNKNVNVVVMRTLKPTLDRLRPSSIERFLVAMLRAALDIL